MILERINENCIVAYVPELEPVFAVMNLLQGLFTGNGSGGFSLETFGLRLCGWGK